MPSKTKSENGQRFDDRIVVQVQGEFKADYNAMCSELGENMSDHIRKVWEAELAAYKARKA